MAVVRGFADREMTDTRQTRKSPTHNRHEMKRGRILPEFSCDGIGHLFYRAAKPIANCVSDRSNIGGHFAAHNRAVGRFGVCCDKAECHCFRACCGDSGRVECLGKGEAGFGAASRPNGDKSPRHKG